MTSVWQVFAKAPEEALPADNTLDGTADGEFTVAAPNALPAHVEEFLALKAAAAV